MDAAVDAAMRVAVAVARGMLDDREHPEHLEPLSTRCMMCEIAFEQESLRHIPVLVLNFLGMHRISGREAKKFKIGPSSRWKLYNQTALSHLLCTCTNVHAWYFCRFDEETVGAGFTAEFPENAMLARREEAGGTVLPNFQPESPR